MSEAQGILRALKCFCIKAVMVGTRNYTFAKNP